jgi:hypothetical protein
LQWVYWECGEFSSYADIEIQMPSGYSQSASASAQDCCAEAVVIAPMAGETGGSGSITGSNRVDYACGLSVFAFLELAFSVTSNCFCEGINRQPLAGDCDGSCECGGFYEPRIIPFHFYGIQGLKNTCNAQLSCPSTWHAQKWDFFFFKIYIPEPPCTP